jgi:hypothetical protein
MRALKVFSGGYVEVVVDLGIPYALLSALPVLLGQASISFSVRETPK